jgi:hypothetical protein
MSELIEINEDNCVLDEGEISNLKNMIACMLEHGNKKALEPFKNIFLKIKKLNELAKERQEKQT